MRRRSSKLCIVTALAVLSAGPLAAEDWPQFRGPQRNGVSAETGLLDMWPEGGPKELWRRPIGEGYSAATVVGDRLYTLYAAAEDHGEEGEKQLEFAAALDAGTGAERWRTAVGDKIETEFGNGPRSTPTVDGDTVYVLGSHGDFAALATADGAQRWGVKLTDAFGSRRPGWGYATSALVDGDLVLVAAGGREGNEYVALDKKTGEVEWSFGDAARGPGYNSPLAIDVGGERRFVTIVSGTVRAIGADGEEAWSRPFQPAESHGMPIFLPPDRYFASGVGGDDEGAVVFRVASDGGEPAIEEVWKSRAMKNHFSSSLHHDGYIYGFDNATFKCISAATGETAWAKRGLGKGSLIYADGDLIVLSDRGKLLLVEATPEGYKEKGSVQALEGKSWTAPTLSEGRLYLRNHTEMVSYDLKG